MMKSAITAAALLCLSGTVWAGEVVESRIKLFQFEPGALTVKAGTTVKWVNGDDIDHSVTARDQKAFDSGFFRKGGTFEFTFASPGTFDYFCKRHPSMKATVTVTE